MSLFDSFCKQVCWGATYLLYYRKYRCATFARLMADSCIAEYEREDEFN